MEERVVKAGWIHKRSAYLRQWRKRWLILRESSLSTYKSKDITQNSTMYLSLNDISEAVASTLEFDRDFCFKVVSDAEYYMTVDSDKEMCIWLNFINHIRLGRNISAFDAPHYSREVKALSDESLITSFSSTKSIINERESEMMEELIKTYDKYRIKAEEEHKALTESLSIEIENCRIIAESLKSEASVLSKIQQIQRLTKIRQNFRPFDNINESKLQISVDSEVVSKLIRPNIRVALRSQAEMSIRRTKITRALKWRYTGNRIDALTFSVSHDIELIGVGICGPYKAGGQITVKEFQVLRGSSSNSPALYKNSGPISIKYNPDESVHILTIEDPVSVKSETKYTVSFIIDGSHTYKCVDCDSAVDAQVSWKFFNTTFSQNHQTNRCDTTCGPIADFHFILS
jgi:hypothetical protein